MELIVDIPTAKALIARMVSEARDIMIHPFGAMLDLPSRAPATA